MPTWNYIFLGLKNPEIGTKDTRYLITMPKFGPRKKSKAGGTVNVGFTRAYGYSEELMKTFFPAMKDVGRALEY